MLMNKPFLFCGFQFKSFPIPIIAVLYACHIFVRFRSLIAAEDSQLKMSAFHAKNQSNQQIM